MLEDFLKDYGLFGALGLGLLFWKQILDAVKAPVDTFRLLTRGTRPPPPTKLEYTGVEIIQYESARSGCRVFVPVIKIHNHYDYDVEIAVRSARFTLGIHATHATDPELPSMKVGKHTSTAKLELPKLVVEMAAMRALSGYLDLELDCIHENETEKLGIYGQIQLRPEARLRRFDTLFTPYDYSDQPSGLPPINPTHDSERNYSR